MYSKFADISSTIRVLRYYAGWADKNQGKVIEVSKHLDIEYDEQSDKVKIDQRYQACIFETRAIWRCGEPISGMIIL